MQRRSNDKEYYFQRGFAFCEQGRFEDALRDYGFAIGMDTFYVMAYNNRGYVYSKLKNYDKAIEDYDIAILLDPECACAYNNRGYAYRMLGNIDRAVADYIRAIQLDWCNVSAHVNLGYAYFSIDRYADAVINFVNANDLDQDVELPLASLAIALEQMPKGGLDEVLKDSIFCAIQRLPLDKQISLLEQCLDPKTTLGDRFWQQEGLFACSFTRGTLKEICDRLRKLNPDWVMPGSQPSKQYSAIFFEYRSPGTLLPELNPVFDSQFYKL